MEEFSAAFSTGSRNLDEMVSIQDNDFKVSALQNRFKQSSTALLSITFSVFVAYSVCKFLIHRKTNFGLDVSLHLHALRTKLFDVENS